MAGFSDEEGGGVSEGNLQLITLNQFQTIMHEFLVDIKEMIRNPSRFLTSDFNKATVLQDSIDTQCQEVKAGCGFSIKMVTGCFIAGIKEQDQKEDLKDLKYYKLEETFPDLFIQKKGKVLRRAGVFDIKNKIGNGTFQYLYKNGLINLLMENCGRPKGRYMDDLQPQLENSILVVTNAPEGLRRKWRSRKKFKEKN